MEGEALTPYSPQSTDIGEVLLSSGSTHYGRLVCPRASACHSRKSHSQGSFLDSVGALVKANMSLLGEVREIILPSTPSLQVCSPRPHAPVL